LTARAQGLSSQERVLLRQSGKPGNIDFLSSIRKATVKEAGAWIISQPELLE